MGYILLIIILIVYLIKRFKRNKTINMLIKKSYKYKRSCFLTNNELRFYNILKDLNDEYIIVPQVNLGTIVKKINGKYRNELFKNIDFGLFTKDFELLLLIELNDRTHRKKQRRKRDMKLKEILKSCDIPLLTFYTDYPNEKKYVINRIKKAIFNEQEINLEQKEEFQ